MVSYRRTKNEHDPDEPQAGILDPYSATPTHTIHPNRHAAASPTVPKQHNNKDECILDLIGPEKDYWNGTEAGRLKIYNFPGTCAGGDWSNHEKTKSMGAGFCTLKELHWDRRDLRDRESILHHNVRYGAGPEWDETTKEPAQIERNTQPSSSV
jgi:hypothetical protein